jgi:fatty-acyl-CoA synthase
VESQPALPRNYVHHALELFTAYGDAEAVVHGQQRLSYQDMSVLTLRLAGALRLHGVAPDSTVAVLVGNLPEAIALQFALHLLGCRSAWLARAPRVHQLDFLGKAEAATFVYDVGSHGDDGAELAAAFPGMPVLCLGGGAGPDLMAACQANLPGLAELTAGVTQEPQSLFQTSGTSGRPKLVHHRHLLFQVLPMLAQRWVDEGRPVLRHLSMHRFSHVASQMATLMVLFMGGTVVMLSKPVGAAAVLDLVARERISSTVVTPPVLYELLDELAAHDRDVSCLRVVTCGGAAATPARLTEAIDRLGPVLRIVYAMSESPGITELPGLDHDPAHPERLRSAGLPYGDVRVQVRGPDGTVLAPGQAGEVWVASALVMAGYWGEPELTAQTLVDGWLRTRDIGYLDGDGYLYLVDRSDDVILTGRGSVNVYSRPVEDALVGFPGVRLAAVIKVPDDVVGEAGHAYVVLARGAAVTPAELRQHVIAQFDEDWAPRDVEFVDSLPLTSMGKVDKRALQERFALAHIPAGQR